MKATKVKNISDKPVAVRLSDGRAVNVSPGETIKNVDIVNLDEVKDNVKVTSNLTEVR